MEPQLPSPHFTPEQAPSSTERRVSSPEITRPIPEKSGEREETRELQPSAPAESRVQVPPAAPPSLPQLTPAPASAPASTPADENPVVAADEDLIEKEWVEKAKQVIAQTKHDPYLQEQAVSKLQADYLQKRYSKTVKLPNDGA